MPHLRPADYRAMPWKDGGGTTLEIALEPPGVNLSEPFAWRVSSAQVERSGSFSRFPGYQRALVLVEGAGMILDLPGEPRLRLKDPNRPVFFSGDDAVQATLIQGPCVDFGLIWDPAQVHASLTLLPLGPETRPIPLAPTTLLFAPQGGVELGSNLPALGPMETLRMDNPPASLEARGYQPGAVLVVVGIRPAYAEADPNLRKP